LFDKNADETWQLWKAHFMEQCIPKGVFAQKKGISLAGITHAIKAIQVKGHS